MNTHARRHIRIIAVTGWVMSGKTTVIRALGGRFETTFQPDRFGGGGALRREIAKTAKAGRVFIEAYRIEDVRALGIDIDMHIHCATPDQYARKAHATSV